MKCTAATVMTNTEVTELIMSFWKKRITGNIDRHLRHASQGPERHSLVTVTYSPRQQTSLHEHSADYKFVHLPILGDLSPGCMLDLEAEAPRDYVRNTAIRQTLTTRN